MSVSIAHPSFPRQGVRCIHAILVPIEKVQYELLQSVRYFWNHYIWLLSVETERNEILVRMKALEAQNSRLTEVDRENERLRSLLDFPRTQENIEIAATVVGHDPSNWARTITIDRGLRDGLRRGLAVVDGHAVVGQTVYVFESSSQVLLLTDSTSAIDALIQDTRTPGIVEGGEDEPLHFQYVLNDAQVKQGERVVASGLDGIFPKGVLIGVITNIEPKRGGLFQQVQLEPAVNLNRLENVLVIVPTARAPLAASAEVSEDDLHAAEKNRKSTDRPLGKSLGAPNGNHPLSHNKIKR